MPGVITTDAVDVAHVIVVHANVVALCEGLKHDRLLVVLVLQLKSNAHRPRNDAALVQVTIVVAAAAVTRPARFGAALVVGPAKHDRGIGQ
jgi:hypothetical protein